MAIEKLSETIYSKISNLSLTNGLTLNRPLKQLSQGLSDVTPIECLMAFIGFSVGTYTGFYGLKTYLVASLIEASLITGLRLVNLDDLANNLEPMLYSTLGTGLISYLLIGRVMDKNRKLDQ